LAPYVILAGWTGLEDAQSEGTSQSLEGSGVSPVEKGRDTPPNRGLVAQVVAQPEVGCSCGASWTAADLADNPNAADEHECQVREDAPRDADEAIRVAITFAVNAGRLELAGTLLEVLKGERAKPVDVVDLAARRRLR